MSLALVNWQGGDFDTLSPAAACRPFITYKGKTGKSLTAITNGHTRCHTGGFTSIIVTRFSEDIRIFGNATGAQTPDGTICAALRKFQLMLTVEPTDIQPQAIVRIVEIVSGDKHGLAGRCFKVLAVDYPYAVVQMIGSTGDSRHSIDLRDFRFAVPSEDFIAAIAPEEAWPEEVRWD